MGVSVYQKNQLSDHHRKIRQNGKKNIPGEEQAVKKSILIIYPHNPFLQKAGIDSRYLQLMDYFKSRNFHIDMFSLSNFETSWEGQDPHEHCGDERHGERQRHAVLREVKRRTTG